VERGPGTHPNFFVESNRLEVGDVTPNHPIRRTIVSYELGLSAISNALGLYVHARYDKQMEKCFIICWINVALFGTRPRQLSRAID
jgi:hypothetical protein